MNSEQMHELKRDLTNRKQELEKIIAFNKLEVREQLTPDESGDSRIDYNHPADMLAGDPDYEKELNLIKMEELELKQIDEALIQMKDGIYGECQDCGASISFDRLKALPYTKYCLRCSEMHDSRSAHSNTV